MMGMVKSKRVQVSCFGQNQNDCHHNAQNSDHQVPRNFKAMTSRAQKLFRKVLDPEPEKRLQVHTTISLAHLKILGCFGQLKKGYIDLNAFEIVKSQQPSFLFCQQLKGFFSTI